MRARLARRRAGRGGRPGGAGGRPDRRGGRRGQRAAAAGDHPAGPDHPGNDQCALPCLPAGPARAHPGRAGRLLDLAAADVRGRRVGRAGLLLRPRPRDLRRDGPRRGHDGGGVPLPPSRPRRRPVRGRERDGECPDGRGPRGGNPHHPARHLLSPGRDRARGGGRSAALLGRHRRLLGRAGRGARGVRDGQGRSGNPQRSRGRPEVRSRGGGVRRRAIPAAPRPRLRAAGRERRLPRRLREDTNHDAGRRRRPLRALHGGPRHAPGGERLRCPRRLSVSVSARRRSGTSRTASGRRVGWPRRAHGSAWAPIPTP